MSDKLWPRLANVTLSLDLISFANYETATLSPEAFQSLARLVAGVAGGLVWTYTEPGDGSLPSDDRSLSRICGLSEKEWHRVKAEVEPFFASRGGRWHLDRPWVSINTTPRFAIPTAIQAEITAREGRVCSYCGDTEGPFDYDHIYPVSRGGTNDPSNLTLACASCNRSKGAKTLREWIGR